MRKAVLIVEDDPLSSEFLHIFLESEGFRVTSVGTYSDALNELQSPSSSYSLVITDINLPDGSGVDIAKHAKSIPETRVIATSGYDRRHLLQNGVNVDNFDALLLKPIELPELLNALGS